MIFKVYFQWALYQLVNRTAGYNASVFAYGQTGSGKSYTMMGTQVISYFMYIVQ